MQQNYIIKDNEREIPIHIIRSKRKTIGIQVAADLVVTLRCPNWFTELEIDRFCEEHRQKILDCYHRACQHFGENPADMSYCDIYIEGTKIPFGDGEITLKRIQNRDENHIRVYRKREKSGQTYLCMASGVQDNPDAYRNAVTGWLREYARAELERKVQNYAAKMQVQVGRITIREQKTRWGSCSSRGNLNFNWKLVLMPERIQDYVVVHELAHRREMNHSAAFWNEVEKILPDYRERREWLRKHEGEFSRY